MSHHHNRETPERNRERLRHEEQKKNPTGNLGDAFNRNEAGGLHDLVNSLGWKGAGILIVVLIVAFIIYRFYVTGYF